MQHVKMYGQNPPPVNVCQHRHRACRIYRATVRIGQERVRVSGDFETIMSWVRLALAEREAAA